jgi:hypothetical protein
MAGALVACSGEDAQEPAPVVVSAGAAGVGGENAGGAGAGGSDAGAGGSDAGGGGGDAGQGAGGAPPPGCINPGPGVCCPTEKCYTLEELTTLGCSVVDLQIEGCPHPIELPMGSCYWYEQSATIEDGKCCYTYFSGTCCGPS